jgi:NTE family protein
MDDSGEKIADLVLEGGGVKGIALVGAISVLTEHGYSFNRVAGTSAGAIVGALVAAGMSPEDMTDVMRETDYSRFQDESWIDKMGPLGKGLSILLQQGIYEGNYLRRYLAELLPDETETFAGLRVPEDPDNPMPDNERFRLVVMASDISRHELVRLPWDCEDCYGADPEQMSVIDAVRASMAIPVFYEPFKIDHTYERDGRLERVTSTLVDGGMLSNFPVDVFDRKGGQAPRWPTFGIKLSGSPDDQPGPTRIAGPLSYSFGILSTLLGWHDRAHINDPAVCARTIFVDTFGISPVAFDLDAEQRDRLYGSGRSAAEKFLAEWNFEEYKKRFPRTW